MTTAPQTLSGQTMTEFSSALLSCFGSSSANAFLPCNARTLMQPSSPHQLRSPQPLQTAPWVPLFRSPAPATFLVGSNRGGDAGHLRSVCLFVCNLAPEVEEATLWRLFGPFGAVRSVTVAREHKSFRCRGFGFVNMTNYQDACLAIHCLNG